MCDKCIVMFDQTKNMVGAMGGAVGGLLAFIVENRRKCTCVCTGILDNELASRGLTYTRTAKQIRVCKMCNHTLKI